MAVSLPDLLVSSITGYLLLLLLLCRSSRELLSFRWVQSVASWGCQ
jgi:hypothetical protein